MSMQTHRHPPLYHMFSSQHHLLLNKHFCASNWSPKCSFRTQSSAVWIWSPHFTVSILAVLYPGLAHITWKSLICELSRWPFPKSRKDVIKNHLQWGLTCTSLSLPVINHQTCTDYHRNYISRRRSDEKGSPNSHRWPRALMARPTAATAIVRPSQALRNVHADQAEGLIFRYVSMMPVRCQPHI